MAAIELLVGLALNYLISLAVNERSDAIHKGRERKLADAAAREQELADAIRSGVPLRGELTRACLDLARKRDTLELTAGERRLWHLLSDPAFQEHVYAWMATGGTKDGRAARDRLAATMTTALRASGADAAQIQFLETSYFDALERALFSNELLRSWRQQLSLDYLRERVDELAGIHSPERQVAALARYREKALAAWDIIDLSNLPEDDVKLATQKLLLRQLYMPLQIVRDEEVPTLGELVWVDTSDIPAGTPWREQFRRRVSVGEALRADRRLVVLGDPGGGKTTMLRWLATATLLRGHDPEAFAGLPDTESLPDRPLIPVLIRCRDLGGDDLSRSFADFLHQHLMKSELLPADAEVVYAAILARIATGDVLLLVDGLDEIADVRVRMRFCEELDRTAQRYPDAPIVATSRIVGYRDMPYRMKRGFRHGTIAELSRADKDRFATRWTEVTEQHLPAAERIRRADELRTAIHSSDRIERLTGNPMLLTTVALVKRKVGKLPSRRNKLYAEAVSVLLNWNPGTYQPIDDIEAIPQLEYVAYYMCEYGLVRVSEGLLLDLLQEVRTNFPHIRPSRGACGAATAPASPGCGSSAISRSRSTWPPARSSTAGIPAATRRCPCTPRSASWPASPRRPGGRSTTWRNARSPRHGEKRCASWSPNATMMTSTTCWGRS
jgi:hypothetical protein